MNVQICSYCVLYNWVGTYRGVGDIAWRFGSQMCEGKESDGNFLEI